MAKRNNTERLGASNENFVADPEIIQEYLDTPNDTEEGRAKREAIKKRWKKENPRRSFRRHLEKFAPGKEDLAEEVDAIEEDVTTRTVEEAPDFETDDALAIPATVEEAETEEEVVEVTKASVDSLKEEIDAFVSEEINIHYISESLLKNGLTNEDLRGGNRQNAAIDVVFFGRPHLAEMMKSMLSNPEEKAEAQKTLDSIALALSETYATVRRADQGIEEFEENMLVDKISETFGNLANSFREKPIPTIAISAAVIIAGKMLYNMASDRTKEVLSTVLIAGGGAIGLNYLVGALRDDGRTVMDLALGNEQMFAPESVMKEFNDEFNRMTLDDKHATQAMLHLGNVRCGRLADVFNSAFSDNKQEIDPQALFSSRDISDEQLNQIDPAGLYNGMKSLFLDIAASEGFTTGQEPELIQKGMLIFKERYSEGGRDMKLYNAMLHHTALVAEKNGESRSGSASASSSPGEYTRERSATAAAAAGAAAGGAWGKIKEWSSDAYDLAKAKTDEWMGNEPESVRSRIVEEEEELFKSLDSMEWSIDKSIFESYTEMYKTRIRYEALEAAQNESTEEGKFEAINKVYESHKPEFDKYWAEEASTGKRSLADLRDVERMMTDDMLEDSDVWGTAAFKHLELLSGEYEFENHFLLNDTTLWRSYVGNYYDKINWGSGTYEDPETKESLPLTEEDAEKYTDYYIWELNKLISNDPNIAANNLDGVRKAENLKSWNQNIVKVRQIDDIQTWVLENRERRPEVDFINKDKAIEKRVDAEKAELSEAFEDWFESDAKIDERLLRREFNWPERYEESVMKRFKQLELEAESAEEYEKDLREFQKFVVVEQRFIEACAEAGLNSEGLDTWIFFSENADSVFSKIEDSYKENFEVPVKSEPRLEAKPVKHAEKIGEILDGLKEDRDTSDAVYEVIWNPLSAGSWFKAIKQLVFDRKEENKEGEQENEESTE